MSIVKFAQSAFGNLINAESGPKNSWNSTINYRGGKVVSRMNLAVLFGLAALISLPAQANKESEGANVDRNAVEIVTTAFGLERLTQYSANRNALGMAWADHFGMEASYFDLGDSKFNKRRAVNSEFVEDVGGRIDLKLAIDFSAPLSASSRLYSRVGVYLWDVDVNYNRVTHELDASRGGNSRMVGVGAAYGEAAMRVSVELEQVNANPVTDSRDQQRLLLN
ncbi:MAG: hypothetical protein HY273_02975, partial [Gammaproteobacteria bacterium]|nr:hypothetical protein [Gammaproteobacteria bacterium]